MAASVDVDDDDASSEMSIFCFLSPSSLFAPITGEREEKRKKMSEDEIELPALSKFSPLGLRAGLLK